MLDRYGRNAFGWSLLMARRLVEAGVNLVQVNLGQQRDLGHARQRLPAPEGQALPADRPGRLGPAGRPARQRPARLDADRHGRRVRPDAADLAPEGRVQAAGPRPLGPGADASSSRAAESSAAGSSAPPTRSAATPRPTRRRPRTWPRRSTRRSASRHRRLARRARPPAPRLPRRADQGALVIRQPGRRVGTMPVMPPPQSAAGDHPKRWRERCQPSRQMPP